MQRRAWVLAPVLVLMTGCVGFYMVGSTLQTGPPAHPKRSWSIGMCTSAAGQPLGAPGATYYQDDEAFYEIEGNGNGARITNTWRDDKGQYYFTRVKTSHGWAFFLPNDATQPAMRWIYNAGQYTVIEANGVIKPVGTPTGSCPLMPKS